MARNTQGRRGFAAMEPEQRRRLARRGGQASQRSGGRERDYDYNDEDFDDWDEGVQTRGRQDYDYDYDDFDDDDNGYYADHDEEEDEDYSQPRRSARGSDRRGFTEMDPDRQRRSASTGGRASHSGGRGRSRNEDYLEDNGNGHGRSARRSEQGPSRRGFAAMDPEKQRRIAAKGGRASHGGGGRRSTSRSANR